jgi:hypothetical protein
MLGFEIINTAKTRAATHAALAAIQTNMTVPGPISQAGRESETRSSNKRKSGEQDWCDAERRGATRNDSDRRPMRTDADWLGVTWNDAEPLGMAQNDAERLRVMRGDSDGPERPLADAERLGPTRTDAVRRDATRTHVDRLGMTWTDVDRRRLTRSDSEWCEPMWQNEERLGMTRTDGKLPGAKVTNPDLLPAQQDQPDPPETQKELRYPLKNHRRASTNDTNPARSLLHTPGIRALSVPAPVMRPTDPRPPVRRNRPKTVSTSHVFDTNDPLQEHTRKRQRVLPAQQNDLWPMWRDLDQGGRRRT